LTRLPLEGLRLLDLSRVWSGPYAARLLADMGAEVIKIEACTLYDWTRGGIRPPPESRVYPDNEPGERPYNRSAYFNLFNRNKYGITLDIRKPRGAELFKNLVRVSDVVLENYSPGIMERYGLGYEILREVNPRIIIVSLSGFGATGPESRFRAMGATQEQMSGVHHLWGYLGQPPLRAGINLGDPVAGICAATAILLAVHKRRRTGKGERVDISQRETLIHILGEVVLDYSVNRRVQKRIGNHHQWMVPHGCYRCRGEDEWLVISVNSDDEWVRFCRVINPSLAANDRFRTVSSRWRNQDELDKLVEQWTSQYDHHTAFHKLQAVGIAAAPVLSNKELYSDPHYNARGFFEEVTHPETGTHRYPGLPWKLSKTPGRIRMPAPYFGQHNEYIFRELLGLREDELEALTRERIIGTTPLVDIDET